MKRLVIAISLILPAIILLSYAGCKINNEPTPWPVYSYTEPIINPPDTFQVVYNISQDGDRAAYITFEEDAVWLVEKLGDARIDYWAYNGDSTLTIYVADTLGMRGGRTYTFVGNNNNYDDFNNFFTQFTKLNFEYTEFEPKF